MGQRILRVLGWKLALAIVVGACGSQAPIDAADPEGVLTTRAQEPGTIDPQQVLNFGIPVVTLTFEPLLRLDTKTLRPIAGAAELPDVSADGLTYRFRIRDDSKFSDGAPVRARDFAFGITRLCDPAVKSPYASVAFAIVGCAEWNVLDAQKDPPDKLAAAKRRLTSTGLRATSDKELVITLSEPAAYVTSVFTIWSFAPVREADVVRGGEQWWADPATFVGNGPFVLSMWKRGERMVFAPNRFFRSPAKLKRWIKLFIDTPEVALGAYRHDEVDVVAFGSTQAADAIQDVERDPTLAKETVRSIDQCTAYVTFNERRPPFDDKAVRLAFAKSIDRDAYVRDVLRGLGRPTLSLIAPGLPGYDASLDAQRFDPEAARSLLASSKHAGTAAMRSITWVYTESSALGRARAEWLQDNWKKNLGVDILLEPVGGTTFAQRLRRPETVPSMTTLVWCADYPDQQDWLSLLFRSTSTNTTALWTGYADPRFDRLVGEADRERDQTHRDDLYREASRTIANDAVAAFLYNSQGVKLRKPWVRGVVDNPFDAELGSTAGVEKIFVVNRGK